ncbi:MAG: hypothetical protein AAF722_11830 [Cyanobacteria bacterium P01_C01_bin.70]
MSPRTWAAAILAEPDDRTIPSAAALLPASRLSSKDSTIIFTTCLI